MKKILSTFFVIVSFFMMNNVQAKGKLTLYCSMPSAMCEQYAQDFSKKFNVDTKFVSNGTGATFSKIKLEKDHPQADVWFGGTIEPHFQAGDLGLLEPYRSPKQAETMPVFKALLDSKKGDFTSIIYMLVLGIGINTDKFAQLGMSEQDYPKCWRDLLDPRLKDQIQLPDPRVSGTAYTIITTLISLWGEEKAFQFLKKLDGNISQYVKSSLVTANLSRGESAVSVGFTLAFERERDLGAKIKIILPCDGDNYDLGGISIIKGARNLDNAKLFVDWALSKESQEIPWREMGLYHIPTNVNAQATPNAIYPNNLINIDFEYFGKAEEGKRLIDRWVKEIKLKP